ncbi:MAG: SxtJ family membrane protein [bacterium]
MMHEIPELDTKGLREFGLVTGAIVAVLFGLLLPWLFGFNFPTWPWIFAAILAVWALVAPDTLRQPYHWWMRFGMLIGSVMNRVVLGIVFFVVMLPIGLIMRALGIDPMARTLKAGDDTYRIRSNPTKPDQMNKPY